MTEHPTTDKQIQANIKEIEILSRNIRNVTLYIVFPLLCCAVLLVYEFYKTAAGE